ncbi:MAG TPA: choice-of-anchor Q domain-containing protein, partial [Candidatus Binatia bacterium]
ILSTQGDSYAGNCTNQTGINGNISTDPLFVDGGAGDYRLQASSPLIDAGNNSAPMLPLTDFERTNRIKDGNRDGLLVVDIGAFESPFHFTTFLRGSGSNGNPSVLFLDGAPSNSTAKFKDSAGIGFSGGNAWQPVGSWSADSASVSGSLETLSDLHLWLGLKNNDDIGTRFDVAAEVWKNNEYIATGQVFCVTNVVRNQSLAKEVVISFSPFTSTNFDGGSDVLTLKVFTRIGTDGSGNLCAGHSNAQGLRVYFDSTDRNARFSGGLD